jgi:hypothetical protein
MVRDVCVYKPGDLNKNGKEGRTSWDSFSYAIQMGHNVWTHINAVQEANRQYDQGVIPNMMAFDRKSHLEFYRDVVDRIFETDDRDRALELVEEYNKFWLSIIGTRGATGKKTVNSSTHFNSNFDIEMSQSIEDVIEDTEEKKTAKVTDEHFGSLFDLV